MNKSFNAVSLCVGVFSLSVILGYSILAWNEPDDAPPVSDTAIPINTSANAQTKAGAFESLIQLKAPKFCIGNLCCSSWEQCIALGGACKANSKACSSNSDCCSNSCVSGICVNSGSSCKAVSQACGSNSECCSNSCVSGVCASGGGGCKAVSQACGSNSECCSNSCVSGVCASGGSSCKTTDQACTTNTDCCSSSCNGGVCQPDPIIVNCGANNLGAGIKRIFVTGPYIATDLKSDTVVNNICKGVAGGGNYKALVYLGGELPSAKLPNNNEFWNCAQVSVGSSQCVCNRVARHKLDLFTDKGGGQYLFSPIIGTESGTRMSGVRVWTNFRPDGTGGTVQLDTTTYGSAHCYNSYQPCFWWGYSYMNNGVACYHQGCQGCNNSGSCSITCRSMQSWYGMTSDTNMQWSYVSDANNVQNNINCLNYSRAIYCVEQ